MVRKVAKEFLHIRDWLGRAGDIVDQGRERYLDDPRCKRPAIRS